MIVGAACDQGVSTLDQLIRESLSIGLDLLAIVLELRGGYLLQLSGQGSHLMIVRASLQHREYCEVYLFTKAVLLAGEYHA